MMLAVNHSRWMAALGAALLHFLWEAALVGCALAAAHPLMRRASARVRYAWNCLALFALPPLFMGTLLLAHAYGADDLNWVSAEFGVLLHRSLPELLPYLVAGWALGVMTLAAYSLGGWCLVQRARRGANHKIPPEWTLRLAYLRQRVGSMHSGVMKVSVGLSAAVRGPCVVGWWRPLILLPLSALTATAPEHLEALLAHELAHIRRHDYLVNLLQRGIEVLFFYHPAVWWISRQASQEREHCCDDEAIAACGDRLGYARALLDAAESDRGQRRPRIALAASGGSLRRRVERIVGHPLATGAWGFAASMAALAVLGLFLSVRPQMAAPPASGAPTPVSMAPIEQVSFHVSAPTAATRALSARASMRLSPKPRAAAKPAPAPVSLNLREAQAEAAAPSPSRPVVVAFSFAAVEACTPHLELVRHLSSAGLVWVDVQPVMRCEPALQPVGVWVLTT